MASDLSATWSAGSESPLFCATLAFVDLCGSGRCMCCVRARVPRGPTEADNYRRFICIVAVILQAIVLCDTTPQQIRSVATFYPPPLVSEAKESR